MTSSPWMPLYVADYIADTGHLNAAEHGAYLLLIMHYWRAGKLPTDERQLQRIARMTAREWDRSRDVLAAFFDADWRHKRIESEIVKSRLKSTARASSGSRGGAAKSLKNKEAALANATILLQQKGTFALASSSQSQSHGSLRSQSDSSLRSLSSTARRDFSEEFAEFWSVYPRRNGSNPQEPARKKFVAACRSGVPPPEIIAGAKRYAAAMVAKGQSETQFVAQAATWINQRRWQDDYENWSLDNGRPGENRNGSSGKSGSANGKPPSVFEAYNRAFGFFPDEVPVPGGQADAGGHNRRADERGNQLLAGTVVYQGDQEIDAPGESASAGGVVDAS